MYTFWKIKKRTNEWSFKAHSANLHSAKMRTQHENWSVNTCFVFGRLADINLLFGNTFNYKFCIAFSFQLILHIPNRRLIPNVSIDWMLCNVSAHPFQSCCNYSLNIHGKCVTTNIGNNTKKKEQMHKRNDRQMFCFAHLHCATNERERITENAKLLVKL